MGSQRLVFDGDIELLDTPSSGAYWFEAIEGLAFGQAVPVTVILTSLLRDGAIVSKTGDDNREVAIPLRVRGSDLLSLAEGEARLSRALGKRTTLAWTPPDGIGPTTVFDVMTSDLDVPPMDDLAELRNERTYTLRLTCLPFGRSVDKITDTAGTAPTSGTVVNSCDSATGWSAPTGYAVKPVPTVDTTIKHEGTGSVRIGAYAREFYTNAYGDAGTRWTNNDKVSGLSIATGANGGYLSILIRMDEPYGLGGDRTDKSRVETVTMKTSTGVTTTPTVTASETYSDGFVRYVWQVPANITIAELSFLTYQVSSGTITGTYPSVNYDAITLSTSATTDQQILKSFEVEGSARTPGSLHIVSPDDGVALGQVLVITTPADEVVPGFQPDVRRWMTAGTTTPDSTALHGSSISAASAVFEVPVSMLTAGPHSIVAAVYSGSNPLTIGVNAQLVSGGTLTGPVSSASVSIPNSSTAWQLVTIGTVYLPPLPMQNPGSSAKVRITFTGAASLSDAFMIPEDAEFSIIDCGTGSASITGGSSHLWIDSPSPTQPQGGWWRGPVAERANARSAWPDAKKPGVHIFEPGTMLAYLVTTNAKGPRIELDYFPAWRTNAAI